MRLFAFCIVAAGAVSGRLSAQPGWFVGGGVGVSTLSGDARSAISANATALSQYKPENGPLAHFFAGRQFAEWLAVQGAYSWNRNSLTLTSALFEGGRETLYEQSRGSRQHAGAVDAMVYFRGRSSWVRPYLSVGLGVSSFHSSRRELLTVKGSPDPPGQSFSATKPGLRAAAGIELLHRGGWGFRYAFLETLQGNPIGARLTPPGKRGLANFQNQFGVVKYFR